MQTLQTGEKIVSSDNGAFLRSKCMKRAPEMTNDCGLKQAETEREEKKNVFIRNYMWIARSGVLAFSAAECRDVNLCLVHRENASERTEGKTNTGKHLFRHFFPPLSLSLSYTQTHTQSQIFCYLQRPSAL